MSINRYLDVTDLYNPKANDTILWIFFFHQGQMKPAALAAAGNNPSREQIMLGFTSLN